MSESCNVHHASDPGSIPDRCDCAFTKENIVKLVGSFEGEAGKKYVVEVKFTKDDTPLKRGLTSCSHYVWNVTPAEAGDYWIWTTMSCCGYYLWTPEANEGSCETGELRNPAAVEHLLELSKNSQVMVASCDGFIRRAPFRTASSMEPSPMSVQRPFATEKLSLIVGTPTREK